MIRAGLISFLALALTPSAHADPRALGPADKVALGGDAALLARAHGGTVTVTRAPLDGGATTQLLKTTVRRPVIYGVDASAERVAVAIGTARKPVAYAGPATGPLEKVDVPDPYGVDVVGDTVMILTEDGATAIAPDGTRRDFKLPERAGDVTFAGDYVAYDEYLGTEPEDEPRLHLRLLNWRTGERVRALDLERGVINLDLRDDGALLLQLDEVRLRTLLPGHDLEDFGRDFTSDFLATYRWAGEGYTVQVNYPALSVKTPLLRAADGTRSRFGLPSNDIPEIVSDGTQAVWQANGCAITAPVTSALTHHYTGTACKLTETAVSGSSPEGLHRRTPIAVRCLVAKGPRCRGTVESAQLDRPVSFAIPTGARKRVRLSVKASVLREARREKGGALKLRFVLRDGRTLREIYPIG